MQNEANKYTKLVTIERKIVTYTFLQLSRIAQATFIVCIRTALKGKKD